MLSLCSVSSCSSPLSRRVVVPGCATSGTQQFPLLFSQVPLSCLSSEEVLWALSTYRKDVDSRCVVKLVSRECRSVISFLTDKN